MKNDVNSSKLQNLTLGRLVYHPYRLTLTLVEFCFGTTSVEVRMLAHTHLPLCPKIVTAICTTSVGPKIQQASVEPEKIHV
jgi:hypothetical protein